MGFVFRSLQPVLLGSVLLLSPLLAGAKPRAAPPGCQKEDALILMRFELPSERELPALPGGRLLGRWKLPLKPGSPVLTYAEVQAWYTQDPDGNGPQLTLRFEFPDPQPWGLPYSFQAVRISGPTAFGSHQEVEDWSMDCEQPGRALFPGQSWDFVWSIPPAILHRTKDQWVELSVFGSRN